MAANNATGNSYSVRQGCTPVTRQYRTPAITETAVRFDRIAATTTNPVLVEMQINVVTADSGETVSVGYTATAYDDLISAASLGTAATGGTFLPAANDVGKKLLTADTDLYYVGSAGSDTGVIDIIYTLTEFNTDTNTGLTGP
jgi:hypothetical protein